MRAIIVLAIICCGSIAYGQSAPPIRDPVISLPPLESLKATRERPLFSPTRRPPPIEEAREEAAPEAQPASEWEFELNGVVIGPELNIAVLRHKGTNEIRRVTLGESVNDWTVDSIATRSVVVRSDSRSITMELFVDNTPKGDSIMTPPENLEPKPRRPPQLRQDQPKLPMPRQP